MATDRCGPAGSSLLATLITYKIRDDAAGLACGSCSCVDAEVSDAEEGKASGGDGAQNGGKKPTKEANGKGKGDGEEIQTWVRDSREVAMDATARGSMGAGGARPQSAVSARPQSAVSAVSAGTAEPAVMDERKVAGLRQAKVLFDEGVLDEGEYRSQKAIILADPMSPAGGLGSAPPPPISSHFTPPVSSHLVSMVSGVAMGGTVLGGGMVEIWPDNQSDQFGEWDCSDDAAAALARGSSRRRSTQQATL